MVDVVVIRRLIEMLSAFYTEGREVEEDLKYSLTRKFLRNIQDVLFTKQIISYIRFITFYHPKYYEMVSSPEMYLRYVFCACILDTFQTRNIYERFLNAFALVVRISIEIRLKFKTNFCKLVPDTFMVLYEEKTNMQFVKRNGFRQFVEYINNPKYLESKCVERDIACFYDPNVSIFGIPRLYEKAKKMMRNEQKMAHISEFQISSTFDFCICLASRVLEITKTKFIPVQNDVPLNTSLSDETQQKTTQKSESEASSKTLEKMGDKVLSSEHCLGLNFDSQHDDDAPGQMVDSSRWERVIEAVIRHNQSKSSSLENSKDGFQTEAGRILEHLQSKIESFIEILEKYGKE